MAPWKAHGWGYEEAHLFMAQAQATKKKGGSRRGSEYFMTGSVLCTLFSSHKTLNDALKNHETRNIEVESTVL